MFRQKSLILCPLDKMPNQNWNPRNWLWVTLEVENIILTKVEKMGGVGFGVAHRWKYPVWQHIYIILYLDTLSTLSSQNQLNLNKVAIQCQTTKLTTENIMFLHMRETKSLFWCKDYSKLWNMDTDTSHRYDMTWQILKKLDTGTWRHKYMQIYACDI